MDISPDPEQTPVRNPDYRAINSPYWMDQAAASKDNSAATPEFGARDPIAPPEAPATAAEATAETMAPVLPVIEGATRAQLDEAVEMIVSTFRKQAAEDQFRETQNRRLHEELQSYRADPYRKAMQPIMSALTRLHAQSARTIAGFRDKAADAVHTVDILASFDEFREDIEMILVDNGVDSFCAGKSGGKLDPARQEIVGYDSTDDATLHAAISGSERPGFEFAGRVLRREAVRVFTFTPSTPSADADASAGSGNL